MLYCQLCVLPYFVFEIISLRLGKGSIHSNVLHMICVTLDSANVN